MYVYILILIHKWILVGVWLWHGLYARHLSWGMNSVFIAKNGGTPETSIREPLPYLPPCKDSFTSTLQQYENSAAYRLNKID